MISKSEREDIIQEAVALVAYACSETHRNDGEFEGSVALHELGMQIEKELAERRKRTPPLSEVLQSPPEPSSVEYHGTQVHQDLAKLTAEMHGMLVPKPAIISMWRKRTESVLVIRLPQENEDPTEEFTDALHRFLNGYEWYSGDNGSLELNLGPGGRQGALPGAYIIKHQDKMLSIIQSDLQFQKQYELMPAIINSPAKRRSDWKKWPDEKPTHMAMVVAWTDKGPHTGYYSERNGFQSDNPDRLLLNTKTTHWMYLWNPNDVDETHE